VIHSLQRNIPTLIEMHVKTLKVELANLSEHHDAYANGARDAILWMLDGTFPPSVKRVSTSYLAAEGSIP